MVPTVALVTVVEETHRRVGGWASALTDNVFLKLFRGLRDAREAWRQHHGITAADASAGVALSLASVIDRFEVAAARLRLGVTEDLLRLAAAEFDDDDDADAEADADANMDVDEEEEEEQEEEGEDAEAAADAPASGPPGAGAAFTLAIRPA